MKKVNNYTGNDIPRLSLEEFARVQLQARKDGEAGSAIIFPDYGNKKAQVITAMQLLNEYILSVSQAIDINPAMLIDGIILDEKDAIEALIKDMVESHFPKE